MNHKSLETGQSNLKQSEKASMCENPFGSPIKKTKWQCQCCDDSLTSCIQASTCLTKHVVAKCSLVHKKVEEDNLVHAMTPCERVNSKNVHAPLLRRVWALVRIRPPSKHELPNGDIGIFVKSPTSLEILSPKAYCHLKNSKNYVTYTVDRVFDSKATQQQVWDTIAPAFDNIIQLNGCSVTVMAFGATGTGKTYTMVGDPGFKKLSFDSSKNPSLKHLNHHNFLEKQVANEKGVIPRLIDALFTKLEQSSEKAFIEIYVSNFEIYKEKIVDLLDIHHSSIPTIFRTDRYSFDNVQETCENKKGGIARRSRTSSESKGGNGSASGLRWIRVCSRDDFAKILSLGIRRRSSRQTRYNDSSSRSHAIWQINIERREKTSRLLVGDFQFVDLAGAERSSSNMKCDAVHMHEMAYINKSLSSLTQCIEYLSKKRKGCRPFRDSKLTQFLSKKLKGQSQLVMIFTTSPLIQHYRASSLTLQLCRDVLSSSIYTSPAKHSSPLLLNSKECKESFQGKTTTKDNDSMYVTKTCFYHIMYDLWTENQYLKHQIKLLLEKETLDKNTHVKKRLTNSTGTLSMVSSNCQTNTTTHCGENHKWIHIPHYWAKENNPAVVMTQQVLKAQNFVNLNYHETPKQESPIIRLPTLRRETIMHFNHGEQTQRKFPVSSTPALTEKNRIHFFL